MSPDLIRGWCLLPSSPVFGLHVLQALKMFLGHQVRLVKELVSLLDVSGNAHVWGRGFGLMLLCVCLCFPEVPEFRLVFLFLFMCFLTSAFLCSAESAEGSTDCTLRLWDPTFGEPLLRVKDHGPSAARNWVLTVSRPFRRFLADALRSVERVDGNFILKSLAGSQ